MTEQMNGTISGIIRYTAKNKAGEPLPSAFLRQGFGMDGDFYANGDERQLCLFSKQAREEIDMQTQRGLCFGRFRENISLDGIDLSRLHSGAKLKIGEAVIEISTEKKRCHAECPLFSTGNTCQISKQAVFAKMLESGVVQVGDDVSIDNRQCTIDNYEIRYTDKF